MTRAPWLGYLASFLIPFVLMLWFFEPWALSGSEVLPYIRTSTVTTDVAWMQALFAALGANGPFGVELGLGFPDGFSPWSHPVLGIYASVVGWLTVGLAGLSPAAGIGVFAAITAGLNAVAGYFFARSLVRSGHFWAVLGAAVLIGANAFIISRFAHVNLMPFFVLPAAFGILLRWPHWQLAQRWSAALVCAGLAFVSGGWWTMVAIGIVVVSVLPFLLRRDWTLVIGFASVLGGLLAGFLGYLLLGWVARVPGDTFERDTWASNELGGHLVDLGLASPALSQLLPWEVSTFYQPIPLVGGGSRELAYVGLGMVLAAAVAILAVLTLPYGRRGSRTATLMTSLSLTTLLFFVAGGLGNLQAGVFALLGSGSPARTWSRLLIVLGILGAGWILLALTRRGWLSHRRLGSVSLQQAAGVALTVFAVAAFLADARVFKSLPKAVLSPEREQVAAVSFIRDNLDPCPVLQLPVTGIETPLVVPEDPGSGFYPWLIAPEFTWSFGYHEPPNQTWASALPERLDEAGLRRAREKGFCAIVYDRALAEVVEAANQDRPGSRLQVGVPSYETERFEVYVLSRS